MRLDSYDPNKQCNRIVKLGINYRSHPDIIKYSNDTFYDATMVSVRTAETNFAVGWNHLPNRNIPVVFHSVQSEAMEVKEPDGFSYYNNAEVEMVFHYIESLIQIGLNSGIKIKQEQIGVASPYSAQVRKISERLKNYPAIDVGTTEFFQGREKPVMIISAVKTELMRNDFLENPRVRKL